jgi:hypothetical protein
MVHLDEQERLSSLQEGGNMPKTGLKQQGGIVDVLQGEELTGN